MNIGILVPHGKYFAAEHLARALGARMFGLSAKEIDVEHLIIIGMKALERYSKKFKDKKFKSVAVIFSDTNFCVHNEWCNAYAKKNKITIYAMPDLHNFLTVPYIPAYQTITIPEMEINKPTDRVVICHSPGKKAVYNFKGTGQIKSIIKELSKRYNIEYKMLSKISWEDCLREKSTAHIFIDQVVKNNPCISQSRFGNKIQYNGGLGKSGIEAMLLKCCVITTMDVMSTEQYFSFPPVVLTDYFSFANDIEMLINHVEYRNSVAAKQYQWAKKYCSPEFVTAHLTRHINETV
jgi:hypothetical protein